MNSRDPGQHQQCRDGGVTRRDSSCRSFNERLLVDGVCGRLTTKVRRQLETEGYRTSQKQPRDGVAAFNALERADDRMRRIADTVAIEVESPIAVPDVATSIDRPTRTRIASAQHDVAPVVGEPIAAERVALGA